MDELSLLRAEFTYYALVAIVFAAVLVYAFRSKVKVDQDLEKEVLALFFPGVRLSTRVIHSKVRENSLKYVNVKYTDILFVIKKLARAGKLEWVEKNDLIVWEKEKEVTFVTSFSLP